MPSIISQGLDLMIYGMGTVFVFLAVLVFVTTFMSKLVNKFAPEDTNVSPDCAANLNTTVDANRMKVLQAAIDAHRNR